MQMRKVSEKHICMATWSGEMDGREDVQSMRRWEVGLVSAPGK